MPIRHRNVHKWSILHRDKELLLSLNTLSRVDQRQERRDIVGVAENFMRIFGSSHV